MTKTIQWMLLLAAALPVYSNAATAATKAAAASSAATTSASSSWTFAPASVRPKALAHEVERQGRAHVT